MFGSAVLEVAIGVIFVFLLVSILCTAIREGIEAWLKTRAAYLEYGIRELLQDDSGKGLTNSLYNHPLVFGLFANSYKPPTGPAKPGAFAKGNDLPSYIPSENFALALMDIAARGPDPTIKNDAGAPILNLEQMRSGVSTIENGPVQRALLTAIDTAQGDLNRAQKNIEAWYDSSMERVSGWYKRSSQTILFYIGLIVAIAFNINAITIADYLYRNGPARAAIVAKAELAVSDTEFLKKNYPKAKEEMLSLTIPIGWGQKDAPVLASSLDLPSFISFIGVLGGWLLTAFAAMLGAPFWFDTLNKVMVLRSTMKPTAKSPEEPSINPPSPAPNQLTSSAGSAQMIHEPDCCDVDMTVNPTVDEELPPARGAVAVPAAVGGAGK